MDFDDDVDSQMHNNGNIRSNYEGGSPQFGTNGGNRDSGYNSNRNNYAGGNSGNFGNGGSNRSGNFPNRGNTPGRNYGGFNKGQGGFRRKSPEDEGPAKLYKPYVITGNKETPQNVIESMQRIVKELSAIGYIMRSGGKEGPEEAVENCVTDKEIHLPWKGFNQKDSKFTFTHNHAKEIAAMFATGYENLKPVIQTFLAQNVRMVMGKDLKSPALFMICWSEDGAESKREKTIKTGNIGHAIAIASTLHIPIFNLGKSDAEARLKQYLEFTNGQTT